MRILPVLVLILGACVAPPGDEALSPDVASNSPPSTNVPRITANALSPSAYAASQLTTGVLDGSGAAAMGPTSQARKVLSFAVSCALSSTQSVTFTVGGVEFTHYGAMGIAPGWVTNGLTATEAAWVSACLLARVNLTSAIVSISARGSATGLGTTSAELAAYQVEEGAFWGNAFTNLGSLTSFSCNGVDQAADDSYGDLPYRECAQWDGVTGSQLSPCGMSHAGLCSDVCSVSGSYTSCSFNGGTAVGPVVTTFLAGEPP
jgi:hypothetical protein